MNRLVFIFFCSLFSIQAFCQQGLILNSAVLEQHVDRFNATDNELYVQHIPNSAAKDFLREQIPLLDIPDKEIEETYYFRWWTFRKHIKQTKVGFVITEFLPDVGWAKNYNTINCPAGHHIKEGRWLRDSTFVSDYINFWLKYSGEGIRDYSFWVADAVLAFQNVHPNRERLAVDLPLLVANYAVWENRRRDKDKKLFWQYDLKDGMEFTASGAKLAGRSKFSVAATRPTINSYMYGDAKAISAMAKFIGQSDLSIRFAEKAEVIKQAVQSRLWNKKVGFFTVLPRRYKKKSKPLSIRELMGYVPWYFNLPDDNMEYAKAWEFVLDSTVFFLPVGLAVTERGSNYFKMNYKGLACEWNGPSWPFATTQTIDGLANFLNNYEQHGTVSTEALHKLLNQYAASHSIVLEDGTKQKWIDENFDPFTGEWITRAKFKGRKPTERGKDYNHSTFCDLVISDLIGVRPKLNGILEITPLVPDSWDWFCLDRLLIQGKEVTVLWDKTGKKYGKGNGLMVFVNGKLKGSSEIIENLSVELN
ncbi:glycosyl hydrolase family 65 protein [Bacteroidota bacterium]